MCVSGTIIEFWMNLNLNEFKLRPVKRSQRLERHVWPVSMIKRFVSLFRDF